VISLCSLGFEEESKSQVDLDWIWKENAGPAFIPPPLVNIPPAMANQPPALPRLQTDSKLLDPEKHFNFIKNECFGGRNFDITTLFRGSEHGFTAAEFHKRVDNHENILYLIKTNEHNRTFGGYFKVKVTKSADDTHFHDKDAFII
jgi:hypothetical protein